MPFIYTVPYIITLVASYYLTYDAARVFDTLFYVSPIVVAGLIVLSKLLCLCKWHKTACVLPLFPQVISFIDYYIIELTEVAAQVNIILFASMTILLLVAAYNIFMR